ncbi:hypothetical protein GGR53DRAFT_527124 [Hypoxylon sp. FL1150]|nr:hypothetical protein GGR53DRAFT_527124 [Hypoxylon sp. FL1150]
MDPRFSMNPEVGRFPLEIIFEVMKCLLPRKQNALISQAYPAKKALLAFSTVLRTTHREAVKHFKQHCLNFEIPTDWPASITAFGHPRTRVLLAFLTVSKATHREAVKQLKRHCIHLATPEQLIRFVRCLRISQQSASSLPSIFEGITGLYLCIWDARFTCWEIMQLLMHVGKSLKRLTVESIADSHLCESRPGDVVSTAAVRAGLAHLTKIEELITTADIYRLVVSVSRQRPLPLFATLKRLALSSHWEILWEECHSWPLHRFQAIEHIVLDYTCIFLDFSFPAELVNFRKQQSIGPVKIVLPRCNGNWKSYFCKCRIQHIESHGGNNIQVIQQQIPRTIVEDWWWEGAATGEIWGWGDENYVPPQSDVDCKPDDCGWTCH